MKLYPFSVAKVINEADNARSYLLQPNNGALPSLQYQPGQFISLHITQPDGTKKTLSANLSSAPSKDTIIITINRENADDTSRWIYNNLKEGQQLQASALRGGFNIRSTNNTLAVLIDDTGIIPVKALLEQELEQNRRPVKLFYDCKSYHSIIFRKEIDQLRENFPQQFECLYHLSLGADESHANTLKAFIKSCDFADFFLCGQNKHNLLCEEVLTNLGISNHDIYIENSSLRDTQVKRSQKDNESGEKQITQFLATLDGKKHSIQYKEGKTLLECMLSAGLDPYYSCSDAHCGYCMAIKKTGELTMQKANVLSDGDLERGYVLLCQAIPISEDVWVDCDA